MFNQLASIASDLSSQPNSPTLPKKSRRKLYALTAAIAVLVIVLAALLIPQSFGSQIQLSLNYKVGERLVYDTTSTVTGQQTGIGVAASPQTLNTTETIQVLSFNGENYTVNETVGATSLTPQISLPLNISKASYYNNFICPGGPIIFYNITSNPTLASYAAKTQVNVGDVWQIPVNTGNASLGLTGEVTLRFTGIQDLTVPAGTYKTFKVDISSSNLTMHYNPAYMSSIHLAFSGNYTLQMTGTTYLEQGTCKLIKADLTQQGTITQENAGNAASTTITSTIHTEKILTQDAR